MNANSIARLFIFITYLKILERCYYVTEPLNNEIDVSKDFSCMSLGGYISTSLGIDFRLFSLHNNLQGGKNKFCIECNLLIYLENIYHVP